MVEWKKLGDLGSYFGGLTGKTKKDFEDGNAKFITYMNVFANPALDVSTVGMVRINEGERQNRVQKGDILFTGSSETPEEAGMSCVITDELTEDFYMNSFCFGLRLTKPENYNLHYFKHLLRSYKIRQEISKSASGVTRFNISKARFGNVLIPVPSLSEQSRIVSILDTFTDSIDNLKQQIDQRRKQYEHYRDQLLDLERKEGVEMKMLNEFSQVLRGKRLTKNLLDDNAPYPVFHGGIEPLGKYGNYNREANSVMVINVGASAGTVGFCDCRFWSSDGCFCISHSELFNNKFLYYYLQTKTHYLQSQVRHAGIPTLDNPVIERLLIPLLTLQEQSRIVSILDTFEASIANLEEQLEMRQKQYEFYRNKLLTFEK